jgi:anthranilate synthase component 1
MALECPLPFTGGWLVFLPYAPDPVIAPAFRIPAALIYDQKSEELWGVAEEEEFLQRMEEDLKRGGGGPESVPFHSLYIEEDSAPLFLEGVKRALGHIGCGDVYQVNLSRGWTVSLSAAVPPHEIYRRLRQANPAPFAASLAMGACALLSSSPERLFSIRQGPFGPEIETRPIAGTKSRSRGNGTDVVERAALIAHPKERAEHIMLVDLERNDLGKVCVPGSVCVAELMTIESYAHVHHLVSSVRGRLRKDVMPVDVLRAVFPGGTITGCPKIRCMQIIAELEGVGRGAYTGSIGYLNRDGSGDFNILIRTMTYEPAARRIRFRTGAGIVADSRPEQELEETRAKARGLLKALEN